MIRHWRSSCLTKPRSALKWPRVAQMSARRTLKKSLSDKPKKCWRHPGSPRNSKKSLQLAVVSFSGTFVCQMLLKMSQTLDSLRTFVTCQYLFTFANDCYDPWSKEYLTAFKDIQKITGEERTEKLVERFVEMEDQNFAMFSCKFAIFENFRTLKLSQTSTKSTISWRSRTIVFERSKTRFRFTRPMLRRQLNRKGQNSRRSRPSIIRNPVNRVPWNLKWMTRSDSSSNFESASSPYLRIQVRSALAEDG